ncbi:MAG: hypothetical protein HYR90_03680 [Candidatus Andersenbacteria bacterium]|nr:hypothetical protein [Candidatus Andersenbacteria bacterium]MBI3250365.1 hypothetical protein [Candidatus Andersenbacteria bacterium]
MVSQELLRELQMIIREERGIDLDMKTVSAFGNTWVDFFATLAKINHRIIKYEEDKSKS